MALKVELKPGERIILGECVVTNADQLEVVIGDQPDAPGRVLDDTSSPKIAEGCFF